MHRFLFGILVVSLGLASTPSAAQALTPEERFELGQKHMRRGYYQKAMEQFSALRNLNRESPYSVKAELAMADLYYKQSEFDLARVAYEDFTRLHPRHPELDYAVYRLGMSHFQKASKIAARDQTWTQQAVHAWANFERRFPESEYLDEVAEAVEQGRNRLALKELRIARFYSKRQAWPAVVARLEPMIRRYPKSEDLPEALSLLAVALMELGKLEQAKEVAARLASDHEGDPEVARLRRQAPELLD